MCERTNYKTRKKGAQKRGLEFTLTYEQFLKLRTQRTCYYTGIELIITGTSEQKPNSWTIDRVDNTIGYTFNNTVACAYSVNLYKSEIFDAPRTIRNPEVYNAIHSKLKIQPRVVKSKQSKLWRIWEILCE